MNYADPHHRILSDALLTRRILLQALRKNYIGYLELRLLMLMLPSAFASPSIKTTGPNNSSTIFNRRIKAIVLEVITSRKLQHVHVLHSYKHKAFQKVNIYKLDLIEQPYSTLTKYSLANDNCKRASNMHENLVFRQRIYQKSP